MRWIPKLSLAFASLVALWGRSSRQIHGLCTANGIEYYHCMQPNQYLAGSKPLSERELRVAFDADHIYGRMVPAGFPTLLAVALALAAYLALDSGAGPEFRYWL